MSPSRAFKSFLSKTEMLRVDVVLCISPDPSSMRRGPCVWGKCSWLFLLDRSSKPSPADFGSSIWTSSLPALGSMIQEVIVPVAAATCQLTHKKIGVKIRKSSSLPLRNPGRLKTPRLKSPFVSPASHIWNCKVKVSREHRPSQAKIQEW